MGHAITVRPTRSGIKPRLPTPAGGLPLGRLWKIEIRIDPSWLLIATLVFLSLSARFSLDYPGEPTLYGWVAASAATVLFFASILVHEMAHSLVAKAMGLDVQGITLFVFGGVSNLKGEARRPRDEFAIAIVGPLTSALLGAGFVALRAVLPAASLAADVAAWLGTTNFILALFNLLPGFPLDGGRVFRALAWAATGSVRKATRWATFAGHLIGQSLIFAGLVFVFGYGRLDGIWLGLVGWFLASAAGSSARQFMLREVLGGLKVRQAMRRDCPVVEAGEAIDTLVRERLLGAGERSFLVARQGQVVGLLTLENILAAPRGEWPHAAAGTFMTPVEKVSRVAPSDSLLATVESMEGSSSDTLPVFEGEKAVGIVTRENLAALAALHLELGRKDPQGAGERA